MDSSILLVHGSVAKKYLETKIEKNVAGVKLHAVWNVEDQWIEDFSVTGYRRNDSRAAKDFTFSRGKTYVFDRAYVDLELWLKIGAAGSDFVTRLKKSGTRLKYIHQSVLDNNDKNKTGVLYDGEWTPSQSSAERNNQIPKDLKFRHVIYRDPESKRLFDFITSDTKSGADKIAEFYKKRWAVELLFRWLKGHLNIRRIAFKNKNAIKIQIAITIMVQVMLRIKMFKENFRGTNWDYLRIIRNSIIQICFQIHNYSDFASHPPIETSPVGHSKECYLDN